ALLRLPDSFEEAQLTSAVDVLSRDPSRAEALRDAARHYVNEFHAPGRVAQLYFEHVEQMYDRTPDLVQKLGSVESALPEGKLARLAEIAADSTYLAAARSVYIDASELDDP